LRLLLIDHAAQCVLLLHQLRQFGFRLLLFVGQIAQRTIGLGNGALGRGQRVGGAALGDFRTVNIAFQQIEFLLQLLTLFFRSQLLLAALGYRLGRGRQVQAEGQRCKRQQARTSQDIYLAFP
jgi:hypothetical protein